MNDPHIQFGIQEAKRIKEEREKKALAATAAEANSSATIDVSTREVTPIESQTNSDEKKLSIFQFYNTLLKDFPFIVNSIQSSGTGVVRTYIITFIHSFILNIIHHL